MPDDSSILDTIRRTVPGEIISAFEFIKFALSNIAVQNSSGDGAAEKLSSEAIGTAMLATGAILSFILIFNATIVKKSKLFAILSQLLCFIAFVSYSYSEALLVCLRQLLRKDDLGSGTVIAVVVIAYLIAAACIRLAGKDTPHAADA